MILVLLLLRLVKMLIMIIVLKWLLAMQIHHALKSNQIIIINKIFIIELILNLMEA